jgi:hypothetical protein
MRPSRANRIDANQAEIVAALRDVPGCEVEVIGYPVDLAIAYRGKNWFAEVKGPKGELTPEQVKFFDRWSVGQVNVVRSVDDALRLIGVM